MSDAYERFLDLATKPLAGNPELHAQARWELSSKLKPEMDDELKEASDRLEMSDRSKWKPAWVGLGLILFGLGLLGLSASWWLPQRHLAAWMLRISQHVYSAEGFSKANWSMASPARAKDPMLFENPFDKSRNLQPTDPLHFATMFQREFYGEQIYTQKIPLALLDRVFSIDPENGWWSYIAANGISMRIDLVDVAGGQFQEWKPEKKENVDLALRLFHQAASAPRFDSYKGAIISRKIELLPPANTVQDCVSRFFYIESVFRGDREDLYFLRDILPIQIRRLADRKDSKEFCILLNDWIKLSIAQAKNFSEMDDLRMRTSSYRDALPSFLKAAQDLQLHEEARALGESMAILDQYNDPFPINKANEQALRMHGSFLTFVSTPSRDACGHAGPDYFYGRYPPITKERLKPNRRSERAFVSQLLILPLGVLLLATSACLSIFRYRNGRLCRVLSGRLAGLFDRSDWIHCLGFGVLLPLLYFALIRYFTPFGGLDRFEGADGQKLEYFRFLLLFLLMVSCSLLVLRRRLNVRMRFFELDDGLGRLGLILTIAGFVILPVLGCCIRIDKYETVGLNLMLFYPSLLAMALLSIWLITLAIRFLLGKPKHALRRHILSRLMARSMIGAFALVCATLPLHRAEEKFWVKRDTVIRADSDHPANTRYEWEVIQQMKSELLEVLSPLEAISR